MRPSRIALGVLALSLVSCGTPRKSPDAEETPAPKTGTGGQQQESPAERFQRWCEAKPGGRLLNEGAACRFELLRLAQDSLPQWDGRPVQVPYQMKFGTVEEAVGNVKAISWMKHGRVIAWSSKTANRPIAVPWDGYKSLGTGDWYIQIQDAHLEELRIVFEACQLPTGKYADCDSIR